MRRKPARLKVFDLTSPDYGLILPLAEFTNREERARERLERIRTSLEQLDAGQVVNGDDVMEWIASWGTETERKSPRS